MFIIHAMYFCNTVLIVVENTHMDWCPTMSRRETIDPYGVVHYG